MLLNIGQLLMSCVALLAMALTCAGVGRPLFRSLRLPSTDRVERTVWSLSLGLLAIGAGVQLLALLGWLYRPLVGMFTVMTAFWGLGEVAQEYFLWRDHERYRSGRELDREEFTDDRLAPVPWILGAVAWSSIFWLALFLGALVPPTAAEATIEHLSRAKAVLESHGTAILMKSWSERPGLHDALLTWALALDGPVAAQLVQVGMAMLVCLAAVMLARPVVGQSWSWFVAIALPASFGLVQGVTLLRAEILLVLWMLLSAHAWRGAAHSAEFPGWCLGAGFCTGAALATGGAGLLVLFAPAAIWGRAWQRTWRGSIRRARSMRQFALASLMLPLLSLAPAALRSAIPANPDPILTADGTPTLCTMPAAEMAEVGRAVHPRAGGRAPEVPKTHSAWDAFGATTSPWVLMAVPGLVCARRLRGLNPLLALAALVGVVAFFWLPWERAWLLAMPFLAIPAVWVVMESRRLPSWGRLVVGVALIGTMSAAGAVPWLGLRSCWAVALGWESRDSYLRRAAPIYRASCIANCMSVQGDHLLSEDPRGLCFRAQVSPAGRVAWHDDQVARVVAAEGLSRYLRRRGLTHLLLVDPPAAAKPEHGSVLRRLAEECLRHHPDSLLCLTDYPVVDARGAEWRYRLYWVR